MNIDGSNQTNLTNNIDKDTSPQFSPDGSKIVFLSDRDGNWEIYIMDVDGSNQTNLTNDSGNDYSPQFQPQP
jgi:Tol biopolymer transport system component